MDTESKLNHFMEVSIRTADSQSSDMLDKYKAGLDEIFENHKREARQLAAETLESKKSIAKKNIKRELSGRESDLKKQLSLKTNAYIQQLFDDIEKRLADYRKTGEYFDYMLNVISECKKFSEGEKLIVYIDENDSGIKDRLAKSAGTDILINDFTFGGGIRAVIPSKNILIDETFETKLSELKNNYRINC